MAASAAMALTVAPSWADDESTTGWGDGDGVEASGTSYSDNITISYGDDFSGISASNAALSTEGYYQGSWVIYADADTNAYTFGSTISGNGFLGVAVKVGNQSTTIDMTSANASAFSGQFMVLNAWNRSYTVALGGSSWANVEYVFGGVSREWWDKDASLDADTKSTTVGDFYALAGTGNSDSSYEDETLQLSSDTSLSGVSGTSKGYTYTKTDADGSTTISIDFNAREAITAANADTTLTITGTGTYEFYGSVGTESVALDIAKTGTGSQTFGGTNYLGNVSVTGGELVLGTLSVTANDTTFSGSGAITVTSAEVSSGYTLTIAATKVDVDSISIHGSGSTISVASGSTLNVTGEDGINFSAGSGWTDHISGDGTLNVSTLKLYSDSGAAGTLEVSVANLNVGAVDNTNGTLELLNTTVGLYGTSSLTISSGLWLNGTDTGTTFNTKSGETLTLSGALTGNGALVKTGEGTLTLSGDNSYYGGTTISEGTVVATSSGALGDTTANSVTIDGGQLEISGSGVTISNAITVVLDSYIMSASEISLADAEGATVYAIVLDDGGALSEDATISVSATSAFMNSLEDGETYEFAIISGDFSGSYDYSALTDAGYTVVDVSSGVIWVTTPEPSMFGLLAGLGALGLVATRRRRNRKA